MIPLAISLFLVGTSASSVSVFVGRDVCSASPAQSSLFYIADVVEASREIEILTTASAMFESTGIRVAVRDDVLQLRGRVPTTAAKYEATKTAFAIPDVKRVENHLIAGEPDIRYREVSHCLRLTDELDSLGPLPIAKNLRHALAGSVLHVDTRGRTMVLGRFELVDATPVVRFSNGMSVRVVTPRRMRLLEPAWFELRGGTETQVNLIPVELDESPPQ